MSVKINVGQSFQVEVIENAYIVVATVTTEANTAMGNYGGSSQKRWSFEDMPALLAWIQANVIEHPLPAEEPAA